MAPNDKSDQTPKPSDATAETGDTLATGGVITADDAPVISETDRVRQGDIDPETGQLVAGPCAHVWKPLLKPREDGKNVKCVTPDGCAGYRLRA